MLRTHFVGKNKQHTDDSEGGKKRQKKSLQNHHLVCDHVAARASLVLFFFVWKFGWSGQFKVEQL